MNKRRVTPTGKVRGIGIVPDISKVPSTPTEATGTAVFTQLTNGGDIAPPIVRFDGREFEIHPLSDRVDSYAYEDSVDFLLMAIPAAIDVYGKLMKVVEDNPNALIGLNSADLTTSEGQTGAVTTLIEFLSKLDSGKIIKEIADSLPAIAAIACHYSDIDVTAADIREWARTPLHTDLWRAALLQLKAEDIMGQFASVQKVISEFSSQAA